MSDNPRDFDRHHQKNAKILVHYSTKDCLDCGHPVAKTIRKGAAQKSKEIWVRCTCGQINLCHPDGSEEVMGGA